jgi:FAD/FMN-containing dehydrogenase
LHGQDENCSVATGESRASGGEGPCLIDLDHGRPYGAPVPGRIESLSRRAAAPPRDGDGRFVNWARTAASSPVRWYLPTSETDLRRVVEDAANRGRRLRIVGAGHSFSRIAVPDTEAVSFDAWVGAALIDRERGVVTVPAGMRLRELSAVLQRDGFALPIVGSIQAQSVAGAIATGTHGSSLQHGNIASLVTGLRMVTGTGDVLVIGDGDARLDGARVHLGALGAVTEVMLRIIPAGRLHQTIEHIPIEEVPGTLASLASSAEYVKVWWLPHAPLAQVVRYARTTAPLTRRPSAATRRWIDERIMHRWVFPATVELQHRRPALTAGINARLSRVYLGAASQVGQDTLMLNTPMPMRHRETEAALAMTKAGEALQGVLDLFHDGRPAANLPLEIRFVRGDDMWMSPAQGADTCQIGAYITDGPDRRDYFERFWQVMRPLAARPHWGKEFDHDAAELRPLYPNFDRFLDLRDAVDPQRVFGSDTHTRMLGD